MAHAVRHGIGKVSFSPEARFSIVACRRTRTRTRAPTLMSSVIATPVFTISTVALCRQGAFLQEQRGRGAELQPLRCCQSGPGSVERLEADPPGRRTEM